MIPSPNKIHGGTRGIGKPGCFFGTYDWAIHWSLNYERLTTRPPNSKFIPGTLEHLVLASLRRGGVE